MGARLGLGVGVGGWAGKLAGATPAGSLGAWAAARAAGREPLASADALLRAWWQRAAREGEPVRTAASHSTKSAALSDRISSTSSAHARCVSEPLEPCSGRCGVSRGAQSDGSWVCVCVCVERCRVRAARRAVSRDGRCSGAPWSSPLSQRAVLWLWQQTRRVLRPSHLPPSPRPSRAAQLWRDGSEHR